MPDDEPSSDPSGPARPSRGVRAFLRRWRRLGRADPKAVDPPPPSANGTVDIVDQAEAFKTLRVEDVMTPRADIVAVEVASPFEAVLKQFVEAEHSRMPVYRETLDDPIGQVHVKDVFKLLAGPQRRPAASEPVLARLRREVLYVPASMRAADLLVRMQASRIHMALVIDEFGGTDGLVSLEDLIEAVVGEIDDEHDEAATALVVSRPGGVFEVAARAPLEDLEAALGVSLSLPELEDEEVDTVAGLVSVLAGRVPQRGEVIVHPAGFEFEVTDADPRRVKRVRVRRAEPVGPPKPAESAPDEAEPA